MNLRLRRSPTLALAGEIASARITGETVYSLSTPTFPDRTGTIAADIRFGTTLTPGNGLAELRDLARTGLFKKWNLPEHECLIVGGAKSSIFCIIRTMLPAGGKVLVVSPHWPSYEDLIGLAHLQPVFHETRADDGFEIDASRLRESLRKSGAGAVICSNPGNPTGRVLGQREIDTLCRETADAGAILLLDESFSNIVFDVPKWHDSVCAPEDHVFVVNSFSKNYHLQGLRLGACLVHRDRTAPVIAAHQTLLSAAPTPSQNIALRIIKAPEANPEGYSEQRRLMLDFAAAQGWPHVATEGGFYLFPYVESSVLFRRELEARRVLSLPGETFGKGYRDHLRVCFGKPVSEIRALLGILAEVVGGLPEMDHGR